MAYDAGMLNKRITIAKRLEAQMGKYGLDSSGAQYQIVGQAWAAEDFNKGVKSLREGAVDAYDTVMFRLRYRKDIDRWCIIQYLGRWYKIESFNESYQDNQIQITATEMSNQDVTIVDPEPTNSTNQ